VTTGYAGLGVAVSHDGGATWQHTALPLARRVRPGGRQPIARFDADGNLYVSYMAATLLGPKPGQTNPSIVSPRRAFASERSAMQANNRRVRRQERRRRRDLGPARRHRFGTCTTVLIKCPSKLSPKSPSTPSATCPTASPTRGWERCTPSGRDITPGRPVPRRTERHRRKRQSCSPFPKTRPNLADPASAEARHRHAGDRAGRPKFPLTSAYRHRRRGRPRATSTGPIWRSDPRATSTSRNSTVPPFVVHHSTDGGKTFAHTDVRFHCSASESDPIGRQFPYAKCSRHRGRPDATGKRRCGGSGQHHRRERQLDRRGRRHFCPFDRLRRHLEKRRSSWPVNTPAS